MKKLYSICWNITSQCNEECKFCYRKKCKVNSLEDNKKIVDNILQLDIDKITFSGGEPLLYDSLFEIVKYIKSKNKKIKLSLTTNASLLNDSNLNIIYCLFDNISLSIDSINESTLKDLGRGEKHISKNKEILDKINGKIKIKINTIATKCNYAEFDEILSFLDKYTISRWKIFRFYPIRSAKEYQKKFEVDEETSNKIEKKLAKLKDKTKIKIQYNNYNEFTTSYFNIYPNGTVENNKDEDIGNLLINSVFDILKLKEKELKNHHLRKSEL